MKRLNEPMVAITAICLIIFLFIADNQVSGQGTSQRTQDTQQESIATAAPAASASPNEQTATIPQHSLTIAKTGSGQGRVTNNPPGVLFKKGTLVTLHAIPDSNSVFEVWSGSCSGSYKTCSVNMTAARAVTASFYLKTYTIHVRSPVNGVIHPFGAVKVTHGEKRRFQIIPLPGYRVSEVLVDKVSVGAVNSHTFNNVTGDHKMEVIFVKE
jgi:hypothetical protein